jgi:fructose-specific PTS system IIA-like component
MTLQHHFTCPLPNGVHARPASALEQCARVFVADVNLLNQRTLRTADTKSVLAIIGADIRHNDPCVLTVSGPDQQEAMSVLSAFLKDIFPHCDDALPAGKNSNHPCTVPPVLCDAGVTIRRGTAVVPGLGQGIIVTAAKFSVPSSLPSEATSSEAEERESLDTGLRRLNSSYEERLGSATTATETQLLTAHQAIARDSEFRRHLQEGIAQRKRSVAGAIAETEAHFSAMLAASGSALLRERALDIQDVCSQLLHQVYGDAAATAQIQLKSDSVVLADSLTPSEFLALARRFLKGLVLAQAGTASHTVILARSFGIPTLTGVPDLAGSGLDGQEAVVDANLGALVTGLTTAGRRYYEMENNRLAGRRDRESQLAIRPAATRDGHRIEIAANISSADEALPAFAAGVEGIGLFRTEMLFLGRESAPGEEEQFEAYRGVLAAAGGQRTAIIRTFDIGGDKELKYLQLPAEENPFLGYRGVRIYPEYETLFRTQVRALVRASAHGRLKVMVPMLATVEEARWVKKIVATEQQRCAAQGITFDPAMPFGAMIEVPAAVFAADALCGELDFFSIGSNDLLQYFMAVDRANPRVASLYHPLQPAFLRLLKQMVDSFHSRHKWVGLCGEMGGQPRCLPLLAGLGLDEISVTAPSIPRLKADLAGLEMASCRRLLDAALQCATAEEVAALLDQSSSAPVAPLLEPDLVLTDVAAATKAEAIKLAVDRLYVMGRSDDPGAVEEAVWQREATYSTGFGHGFAIPHCKTNAVQANSLVLLKLRAPVPWGSLDGAPVGVVVLLVMRESDRGTQHMKVFAQLARQLMREDFRRRLEQELDGHALCAFLRTTLQV